MIVGSLFSGIGGIDLGLERAGFRVAWQCEADEYRRAVLAARFPGVECADDVREVSRPSVARAGADSPSERRVERVDATGYGVDLVCGGFPCQDLSVAGRRAGLLAGERSSLFFEYARIADALLAPGGWILIENVPGLLSSNGGRDYAVLLATLAELGFHDLAWRVLDSRHFGVAQRRRRVYILARRARGSRACEVLLEPESGAGDPQTRREAGTDVAGTLGGGSGSRGWPQDTERMTFIPDIGRTLTAHERWDGETETFIADTLASGSHPASNMPGRRREDDTNIVSVRLNQTQSWGDPIRENEVESLEASQGMKQAVLMHGVRRLTPVECERLQGFPDGWTDLGGTPDSKRYAALGDAVTVNVAEWIGRRLMATLSHGQFLDTDSSEVA